MATILVIEDDQLLRRKVERILESASYGVLSAGDGAQGVILAMQEMPDLILCDIMMPELNGYGVLEQLQSQNATRSIPFVFLTAKADRLEVRRGMNLGADDYLTKPFEFDELLATVEARLARRGTMREEDRDQLESLRELSESKDRFLSILSHDLKGSFTGLLGASQILAEKFDEISPDMARRMVRVLNDSAHESYAFLMDLLEWSRSQIGAMSCVPERIDLKELCDRAIVAFQLAAEQKNVAVSCAVPAPTWVVTDPKMTYSVLHNVVSNALKFTWAGGNIELSARRDGEQVEFVLRDSGVGMSEESLERLFDPAQQHRRIGTAGERGTGLGLLICKDLIEKNGGTIRLESELDRGTTVRVRLPAS